MLLFEFGELEAQVLENVKNALQSLLTRFLYELFIQIFLNEKVELIRLV